MIATLQQHIQSLRHRIRSSVWAGRLLRGSGWSAAGTAATYAVKVVSFMCASRLLGETDFGKLGMIQITVAMFNAFAGFGLGVTATKHIAEFRSTNPDRAGRIIGITRVSSVVIAGACCLVVFVIAPWLTSTFLPAPDLLPGLQISTIALFFGAINGAQIGVLSGFEAFRSIAFYNFTSAVPAALALVAGAYFGGLNGAIVGYTAGFVILWAFFFVAIERTTRRFGIRVVHAGCLSELPVLWEMGLPATLSGLLVTPVLWLCSAALVYWLPKGEGFAQVGIINAANQWRAAILFVPALVGSVAISLISERASAGDYASAQRLVRWLFRGFVLASLPMVVVIGLLSPWIMWGYNPEYASQWLVLVLVVVAASLQACQSPVIKYFEGTGRMWPVFVMNIGQSSVLLIATYLLVRFGALGLALATVISFVFHGVWLFAYLAVVMRRDRRYMARGPASPSEMAPAAQDILGISANSQ